jgi:hypothetical protein
LCKQAGDGGQQAPADQAPQDQRLDAVFLRIGGAGNLEQEIAQEEQRAQQRAFRGGDPQVGLAMPPAAAKLKLARSR